MAKSQLIDKGITHQKPDSQQIWYVECLVVKLILQFGFVVSSVV